MFNQDKSGLFLNKTTNKFSLFYLLDKLKFVVVLN